MTAGTIVRFVGSALVICRPMRWDPPTKRYTEFEVEALTPAIVASGGRDPKGCVQVKILFCEDPVWVHESHLEVMGHIAEGGHNG